MTEQRYTLSLIFLCTAAITDLIAPIFIGLQYPGYSHITDTISTLGTSSSPVQLYQCITLVFVGLIFLFFSIFQHRLFNQKSWAHKWYSIGIFIFSIGCIFAGVFPEDCKGTPETISGKIHGIASGVGFLFLILNPLWAFWIKEFRAMRKANIVLFVLGLTSFIIFLSSENVTSGILQYTGLFQRINLTILYGALIINFSQLNHSS
mgnify:CR=1 FL=1